MTRFAHPVGGRRVLIVSGVAMAAAMILAGCGSTSTSTPPLVTSQDVTDTTQLMIALKSLESDFDARVGIAALDTETGTRVEFRATERFGYASTVKAFVAAQLLREVAPADREELATWDQADVDSAGYSPVTSKHVAEGLTFADLAEAAVRESDNTAMNLVLERIGGPSALDATFAQLGDAATEVVNGEPELNTIQPHSTADTTTPSAFTTNLAAYLDEAVLKPSDRAVWLDWMSGNATGDTLIRAGAPEGWVVADKSGGAGGIRNDIALVTPPGRQPIVLSIFTAKDDPGAEYEDELVEQAAALVLDSYR